MVNEQLLKLVNVMSDTFDTLGKKIGLSADTGGAAKAELGMFMMYLSASDGTISWDEAKTISEICDLNLTPNGLGKFIRENNIYSTEFEEKVPVTFELAVKVDNILYDNGATTSLSETVINTYRSIGQELIKSDGDVDDNEMTDFRIYINMLEEYRDRNFKGAKGEVSGFSKNGGSSVPSKNGVSAPRKG